MTKKSRITPREAQKRLALLKEARALCQARGLTALTLEETAANAGISKRTLYAYFHSREQFMAAVIVYDSDIWREWFFDAIREKSDRAAPQLRLFFETIEEWSARPDFQGCLFAQALCLGAILPAAALEVARAQYEELHTFLTGLVRRAGIRKSGALVANLLLPTVAVLGGVGRHIDAAPGRRLRELANALLAEKGLQRKKLRHEV